MRVANFTILLASSSLLAPTQLPSSDNSHGSEHSPELPHCDKKCRREYRDRHAISNAATAANDALENFAAWKECGSQDWCTDAINMIVTKSMMNAVANSSLIEPPTDDLKFAKHVLEVGNVAALNSLLDTYNMLDAMRKNNHDFLKERWNATQIHSKHSYANYTEWVSGSPHVPLPPLPKPKKGEVFPPQGPEKVLWDAGMLHMDIEHPSFNETVFREVLANQTAAEHAAASLTTSSGPASSPISSIDSAAATSSILETVSAYNFATQPAASRKTTPVILKHDSGQGNHDDDDDDKLNALGALALLPAVPAVFLGAYKGTDKFLNWWNNPSRITGYTRHTISNAAEISAIKTWPEGVAPTKIFDVGKAMRDSVPKTHGSTELLAQDLDIPHDYYTVSTRTDQYGFPEDYAELKEAHAAQAAERGKILAQAVAEDCGCLGGTASEDVTFEAAEDVTFEALSPLSFLARLLVHPSSRGPSDSEPKWRDPKRWRPRGQNKGGSNGNGDNSETDPSPTSTPANAPDDQSGVRTTVEPSQPSPTSTPVNAPGDQSGVRTTIEPTPTSTGHASSTASHLKAPGQQSSFTSTFQPSRTTSGIVSSTNQSSITGLPKAVSSTTLNSTDTSMPYITLTQSAQTSTLNSTETSFSLPSTRWTPPATTSTLSSTIGVSSSEISLAGFATAAPVLSIGPVQPLQTTAILTISPAPAPALPTIMPAALRYEECTPAWWSIRRYSWIIPPKGDHPNYCFYTNPTPFHFAAKDMGCLPNFRTRKCRAKFFDRQIDGLVVEVPKAPTGVPEECTAEWKYMHLGWWVKPPKDGRPKYCTLPDVERDRQSRLADKMGCLPHFPREGCRVDFFKV